MEKIEFGKAAPVAEWERWDIEGLSGEEITLTTPDGRFYHLAADEKFILEPKKPGNNIIPQAYIEKGGVKIPFEQWASGKPLSQ